MKKNIISILAGVALLAGFSMVSISAYAGTTSTDCEGYTALDVQTSANVICNYASSDTDYGVATGHKSGTKIYISSNAMGKVYYNDVRTGLVVSGTIGTAATNAEGASAVSGITGSWTEVGK